jgi:general secretion pathway protein C
LPSTQVTSLLPRLPGLVSLLLAVIIGAVLAQLTWQIIFPPTSDQGLSTPAALSGGSTAAQPSRTRSGLAVPLFGAEETVLTQPTVIVPAEAPPTRLDLKLRGVAAADEETLSWAIVEGPDRQSLPYRIGDALPGEAELLQIETDRVILRHDGAVEALYFSDEAARPAAAVHTTATSSRGSEIRLSPQSSTRIREYLGLLPSDPTRMTELVRALPVMENGVLKGFRLFPGQQRALFGEAGLRRGDIATRINGLPLDDPARGMELLNQLASASRFEIEILRRGQPQVLDIRL